MDNVKIASRPEGLHWQLLTDSNIYSARNELGQAVQNMLGICADKLLDEVANENWLPEEVKASKAKITRGENYQGKTWMVLDYPRVFEKESVFAFRTLFLYGDAVHCTFHISGRFLEKFNDLPEKISHSEHPELLLCNEGNPWVHHVNAESFKPLSAAFADQHKPHGFIKFGKMIPFTSWEHIPEEVTAFFRKISDILSR